jgi:hypothetical protein
MQTTKASPRPHHTLWDVRRPYLAGLPLSSALRREWPHFAAIALFILPVHGAFSKPGQRIAIPRRRTGTRCGCWQLDVFLARLISAIAAALSVSATMFVARLRTH